MMPAGKAAVISRRLLQGTEQALGVFFFLKRGFGEDVGDLQSRLFSRTGKIIIAVAGLRFTGKGGEDIPFQSAYPSKISIQSLLLVINEGG